MSSEKYSPTDGIVQEDQAARVTVQRLCNLKKTWVEPEDGPPPFEYKTGNALNRDLHKFREFESTKFGGNKCQDKNANGSQPAMIHDLKINKAANNSSCEKNNLADVNNIVPSDQDLLDFERLLIKNSEPDYRTYPRHQNNNSGRVTVSNEAPSDKDLLDVEKLLSKDSEQDSETYPRQQNTSSGAGNDVNQKRTAYKYRLSKKEKKRLREQLPRQILSPDEQWPEPYYSMYFESAWEKRGMTWETRDMSMVKGYSELQENGFNGSTNQ